MIILRRAGFGKEVEMLAELSAENVLAITPHLLKFSKIESIEERLKEMLQQQGPQVLLEAAVEDSLTAADKILLKISNKITNLELSTKQAVVSKLEDLLKMLKDLKDEQLSKFVQIPTTVHASITAEVSSVSNALRDAVNTVIGTQLTNHLQGYHGMEDRNAVFGRICEVKGRIGQPAQNEMTGRWNGLGNVIRNAHIDIVRGLISGLKSKASSLQLADPRIADDMPTVANLISDISLKSIKDLDNVDISGLVPVLDAMNLHVDASSIPNDKLNHISQRIKTKYRKERRTKKKKTGFLKLGRKRVEWYESVPYQVHIYDPNIDALKNVFSTHASNPWMTQFQVRVENAIAEMSKLVRERIKKISEDVLSAAEQEVQRALERSREAEHNAQLKNSALTTSQHDIEDIVKSLTAQRRAYAN